MFLIEKYMIKVGETRRWLAQGNVYVYTVWVHANIDAAH